MEDFLPAIEDALDSALPRADERPARLSQALRWAVEGGGKRLRPQICLAAARAAGGDWHEALPAAVAIELLHSYTLVHDDLPCMDDDRERRGKPSVWVRFGEAAAVLAADALQAMAFAQAAQCRRNPASVVACLAAAGLGVVRGQVEDVDGGALDVDYVYDHKTADLFAAAAEMGALAAGAAAPVADALSRFGRELGLAFQYEDDLLDGDAPCSPAEARQHVADHTAAALATLDSLPGDTAFLRHLAHRLMHRDH